MVGLALEGGGAKGAYQLGAYKALIESGYKFDAIVGTSIGSINAALLCQGGYDLVFELWNNVDASLFGMDPLKVKKIVNKDTKYKKLRRKVFYRIIKNKGIDLCKLRSVLEKYIDEDKIRKSDIKFGLVTVRLKGYKPKEVTIDEIPEGKLIDYLIASCSLPVFKLSPLIDGHIYIDGGYYNVLPLTLLERIGCTEVIGLRLKRFGLIKKLKRKSTKVRVLRPLTNTGSIVFIDHEVIMKNIELGYKETLKQLSVENK